MASKRSARAGTYTQRLIENEYVQENLAQAAESLRAAYARASKRRLEPTRDEKVRRQLREAALSIVEAVSALKSERRKPKPRRARKVLVVLALAAGAGAAVLAANEDLRRKIFGGDREFESAVAPPQSSDAEVTAVT